MRNLLIIIVLLTDGKLPAQVFQRGFEGAASLSLGSSTLAFPGLENGVQNEASLGFGGKLGVFAGGSLPFSLGGWQSVQVQGFGNLNRFSGGGIEFSQSAIEVFGEQRFKLMYGRRLSGKVFLGGSFDFLRVWADEYGSASAPNFSLSFLAQPLKNFWVAGRVFNPISLKINDLQIPTRLRLGFCWKISPAVSMLGETEKDIERQANLKFGIQYLALEKVVFRTGFRSSPARFGLGTGLNLKKGLSLDFGSEWHPVLGLTPACSIIYRKK